MTSHFTYGGLIHPDWEMNLASYTVRVRISPRGKVLSHINTMRLEGEVQANGESAINTRLNSIIAAYSVQNQDAKFYVNGVLTPHQLPNGTSISGVKVLEHSQPKGDAGEYVNKRTLAVVIQAEYDSAESQLVDWEETVRWVGNTGPREEVFQGFLRPRRQRICARTAMTIIQTGRSVGWAGYVLPPGPIYPLLEHEDQRIIHPGTPKSFGQALRMYPTHWTYTHTSDLYTEAFPNIR